jgi:methyl-CpG-binding domain protein 4
MQDFFETERLIQEEYIHDKWKMVVVCILLNQTNNKQVRPILEDLFKLIPDAEKASATGIQQIAEIIRPTGFQNVKADRIVKMSKKWASGDQEISKLPGVGKYALESWRIFVDRDFGFTPTDKKLNIFLQEGGNDRLP